MGTMKDEVNKLSKEKASEFLMGLLLTLDYPEMNAAILVYDILTDEETKHMILFILKTKDTPEQVINRKVTDLLLARDGMTREDLIALMQ